MTTGLHFSNDCQRLRLGSSAELVSWNRSKLKRGHSATIAIPNLKRWLAISRVNIYWVEPQFGRNELDAINSECQLLLWQDTDKHFHVAVPLCDQDFRAHIGTGSKDTFRVNWSDGLDNNSTASARLLYLRHGKRAHQLIEDAFQDISQITDQFEHRSHKTSPPFVDYLSWCTWDAFYHSVDQKKIRRGLLSFRKGGVQLGHMILDDGMIQHRDEQMTAFAADPKKFPHGVKSIADMAKNEFGLQSFGIWHAFQGYWRGLDPNSELGKQYKTFKNRGYIRPWEGNDQLVDLSCIDPNDIYRFYFDYYRYLSSQGVDMTKVDNQSALERYTDGKRGRVTSMRAYQEAYQSAAQHFFHGNTLHCMSSGSDVGMHMRSTNAYRNSDDYFPKKGPSAQQHHIFVNAYNATLSSQFSIPDWDMFQTHGPCPAFHAAARALSGGPVYVCDYPGKQDFTLLKKLALSDGTALRCQTPALVCEDSLFTNVEHEAKPLKIYNHNDDILLLGLFHCQNSTEAMTAHYRISDHPDAQTGDYACYSHQAQALTVCKRGHKQTCTLAPADFEIVTCSPIHQGIAALGLLDKYNGSAAIEAHGWDQEHYFCALRAGSPRIGFYCARKLKRVFVNGTAKSFRFDDGLLLIQANVKSRVDIVIHVH